jgi:hypothetical protein
MQQPISISLSASLSLSLARGADFLSAELQKRKNFLAGCMRYVLFFSSVCESGGSARDNQPGRIRRCACFCSKGNSHFDAGKAYFTLSLLAIGGEQ